MTNNVSSLTSARIKRMTYVIMPGNGIDLPDTRHDLAYQLWKSSWQKTYEDLKTSAKLKADDFTRQDIVSVLYDGNEAVSMLLHTRYNLELAAIRDHSYMASYPPEVVERLRQEGHINLLSMEYLTLSAKWRKAMVGVPIAKVIIGLGVKIVESSGLSAIAVTRVDRSVNEMFGEFGAQLLVSNVTMHNVAVDLMMLPNAAAHSSPDPEVAGLVESFWRKREDMLGITQLTAASKKAA